MEIPYLNLSVQDDSRRRELLDAVETVLLHGRLILGPEVEELEQNIATLCGRRRAIGVSSGTGALWLALKALGVGPGDEVITTAMSWIATANAIAMVGAKPVFVDIGADLTMNYNCIEAAITEHTKAILPVHYTGKLCAMEEILTIAKKHNLKVVEDAAQAFGATRNGKVAGSFGTIACFSLNSMKVLNAYGEAGIIVLDDETIAEKLVSLRYNGTINRENCVTPSLNGRIDTLQAAMVLVSLRHIQDKLARRREIAAFYTEELATIVTCPQVDTNELHSFYTYTIQTPRRDALQSFLEEAGIQSKVYHPILMPYHSAYQDSGTWNIPQAERSVQEILCIPNHENLREEEVQYIVKKIKQFFS